MSEQNIKLTKLASCGGCGAKVGAGVLAQLLDGLQVHRDENLLVAIVQYLLREITTLYGRDNAELPLDGVFGDVTEQAVKDFQTVNRLPPDGRVDRITWNRLAESQIRAVNEYGME